MPQMKFSDSGPIPDSASTDSSVFELDNAKSRSTDPSWSALSGGTSSSSMLSSLSTDGISGELVARGPTGTQALPSMIPSLMELSSSERIGAAGLRTELQGFLVKVTDMEDQLQALKKTLVHKQKYISTLETNLKRIEGQNTFLKNEVTNLQKDNDTLRQRLYDSDLAGASNKSPTHKMQESPTSEREVQLGSQLDRVLQENASLKQKIMGLEQELSNTIHRLEHTKQRQETRCQEVESLLMHASKELQSVESERDETARLLAEVLNKGAEAPKDESLKTQFESLLLLQKPALTAKELTTIKDRLFAAHRQIDVLETDFREEHEQRLAAERDLARMKAAMRDLERECDTLRLQVQFLQEDFYREHEDKKVLERSLRAMDATPSRTSTTHERTWQRGPDTGLHVYQREIVEHGLYDRSPCAELPPGRIIRPNVHRPLRYRSSLPSDVVCDSSTPADNDNVDHPVTN